MLQNRRGSRDRPGPDACYTIPYQRCALSQGICLFVDEADKRELRNSSVVSLHSLLVGDQSGGVLWRYFG